MFNTANTNGTVDTVSNKQLNNSNSQFLNLLNYQVDDNSAVPSNDECEGFADLRALPPAS